MTRPPEILYKALAERMGGELVAGSESSTANQLRFMIRVAKGPSTARWLSIVRHLLNVVKQQTKPRWSIDISKHYFTTPRGDLLYGFRVILQGEQITDYMESLAMEVRNAEIQAQQIEEVRLNGSPNRKVGGYTDHVMVGPLAVR